jgi:hypothetical protein
MRIVSSCHNPPLPPLLQQRSMAAPTAKQNKKRGYYEKRWW